MDDEENLTKWEKNPVISFYRKIKALVLVSTNLKAKDDEVRERAVTAIGETAHPAAVPALIEVFKTEEHILVQEKSMRALREISVKNPDDENVKEAVPLFVDTLGSNLFSQDCSRALSEINDPSIVPLLIVVLKEGKSGRSYAAEILGKRAKKGDDVSAAVPYLLNTLKDKLAAVRRAAAGALDDIEDESTVPELFDALKIEQEDFVRGWHVGALMSIAVKLSAQSDYHSALKIVKDVTLLAKDFNNKKSNREQIKQRRNLLGRISKTAIKLRDTMNSIGNDKRFPVKRQEIRKVGRRIRNG